MESNAGQREMPRYISQKTVWALTIARIRPGTEFDPTFPVGSWFIDPLEAGYAPIQVSHDWVQKHSPAPGGYYVVYRDGYASYSPAQPFVDGNTAAAVWGVPRPQEPKYTVGERGRLVNRRSGKAIPDEEPVFILRAQDKLAMQVLQMYRRLVADTGQHAGSIDERILAFSAFANAFPERMKYPNAQAPAVDAEVAASSTLNPQAAWPFPTGRAVPASDLDLSSDKPLEQKAEPAGNGETCESCQ